MAANVLYGDRDGARSDFAVMRARPRDGCRGGAIRIFGLNAEEVAEGPVIDDERLLGWVSRVWRSSRKRVGEFEGHRPDAPRRA